MLVSPIRSSTEVAGVILAGGRSSRMGGGDKSLVDLAGQTLLSRAIERLTSQVAVLAINANGDPGRLAYCRLPVLRDEVQAFAGPLAGILAAMDWARGETFTSVVTVAGDTPFFPRDLVQKLILEIGPTSADIVVAASGGRRHPVFALWPVALRDSLANHLAEPGAGRVNAFIERHRFHEVIFTPAEDGIPDPFFNINTPADLMTAREFLRSISI